MKKTIEIFGFITALLVFVSAFFKVMHWPGAGIGLVLSLGLLYPIFQVLYAINAKREGKPMFFVILGSLIIMLMFLGLLFKFQHWPFSSSMLNYGFLPFILFLIIVISYTLSQKPEARKFSASKLSILMIIVVCTFLLIKTSNSIFVEGQKKDIGKQLKRIEIMGEQNAAMYQKLSATHPKVGVLKEEASKLTGLIEDNKKWILNMVGLPNLIDRVNDNKEVDQRIIIEHGDKLKAAVENFKTFAEQNDSVFKSYVIVNKMLDTNPMTNMYQEKIDWVNYMFLGKSFTEMYKQLNELEISVCSLELTMMANCK